MPSFEIYRQMHACEFEQYHGAMAKFAQCTFEYIHIAWTITRIGMPITICFSAIQTQIEGKKKAQSFNYSQVMYRRSISLIFKTAMAKSHPTVGSMDEGRKQKKFMHAISSFGIFLLAMRQQNPKEEWLKI